MTISNLQSVASGVLRLAKKKGFVVAREIRSQLKEAGLPEAQWKQIVEMLRESLNYRKGRYYYLTIMRTHKEMNSDHRHQIEAAVGDILSVNGDVDAAEERRQAERAHFSRPVKVKTESNEEFTALSKDLSPTGIRLITNRSLLGKKLRVYLPTPGADSSPLIMVTRIVWTTAVADGLFENGGTFLEVHSEEEE